MDKLEKYIKMCRLSVRRWFAPLDEPLDGELDAWLDENEMNHDLHFTIENIDTSRLWDRYRVSDVEWQLARFHVARRCRTRRLVASWSVVAIVALLLTTTIVIFVAPYDTSRPSSLVTSPVGVSLLLANGRQVTLTGCEHADTLTLGTAVADIRRQSLVYNPTDSFHEGEYNTLVVPRGTFYHLILSDGTRVSLNADTRITYPVHFRTDSRDVELHGEAFFNVSPDENAPFIVHTGNLLVRVLGTEFNVNTFADNGLVTAALVAGHIQVFTSSGDSRHLLPGQVAGVDCHGDLHVVTTSLKPLVAWKDNLFCFRNAPLAEIFKQIERYYNVTFDNLDDIGQEYYTGDISRNKPLSVLLDAIEKTLPVHFEIQANTIHVKRSKP